MCKDPEAGRIGINGKDHRKPTWLEHRERGRVWREVRPETFRVTRSGRP